MLAARSFPVLVLGLSASSALAQQTTFVSQESLGTSTLASVHPAIDAAGEVVAFSSRSSAFVPGDTNAVDDVFVLRRSTGAITRVSTRGDGSQVTGASSWASVSADGRFVAFESGANDLVAGDGNPATDVFVKDTTTGSVRRASVDAAGLDLFGTNQHASISPDGNYVAFETTGAVLGGLPPASAQIAFRALTSPGGEAVSIAPGGAAADGACSAPAVSESGSYIVFVSAATNLVAGTPTHVKRIYVRDRSAGTTRCLSVRPGGAPTTGDSSAPSISRDGRWIAFLSADSQLVPGDTNGTVDAFVCDRVSGAITRVSVAAGGAEGHGDSLATSISGDGRWIAFVSRANDLSPSDFDAGADAFLADRIAGDSILLTLTSGGTSLAGDAATVASSADGHAVAFDTTASLDPADGDSLLDVYLRERGFASATTVCAGDGTGALCPCFNYGDPGHGCENYALTGGVLLEGAGTPSVTHDTLQFTTSGCPNNVSAVLLQSNGVFNGGTGFGFGDGVRCVVGSVVRCGRRTAPPSGSISFGYGLPGDPAISVIGFVPSAGARRYYQVAYRIQGSLCFQTKVNWSNAVQVDWAP